MRLADEWYMRRALELAALGQNTTRPNPMVGCVITYQGKIIGEGYHQQYGGPHAEVIAVNAVADKSLLPQCKIYVTLEPCSHFGKTPPCADFLIQHGVKSIFICNTDPNPLVAGRGIRKLLAAGCAVHVGLLEADGLALNKRFFKFHQSQQPYIVLKWAESADGFIARANGEPVAISGLLAKKLVHQWRTQEQASMVGTRTALTDNPRLNVREWTGNPPVRIVIDKKLRLPAHLYLFDQTQPTLVYNFQRQEQDGNLEYVQIPAALDVIEQILLDLYRRTIQSVIVEGGTTLLHHFLAANRWDEIRILRSTQYLQSGVEAPLKPLAHLAQTIAIGEDQLLIFKKKNS